MLAIAFATAPVFFAVLPIKAEFRSGLPIFQDSGRGECWRWRQPRAVRVSVGSPMRDCLRGAHVSLPESGRRRISRAGKFGRIAPYWCGAKKTSLSNGLFLQRLARVSGPAFAGRLPAHWAARPPPKSLFSDARCLRRIRVWFCRTRRSPSSLCCLWRSSPSAFCRGTPRRPSSGRRSTTGSRRRP